jgi:hypothetical protein
MTLPVSRSSVRFETQTDEVDSPPRKPVGPEALPRSGAAARNRVGAWASALPAAQPSSALNTGMLAPPSQAAEEVNAQVDSLMRKGSNAMVRDLWVTKGDAREAVALLEQLPAGEYRKALSTMNDRTLSQLCSEMDAPTRAAFFEQARQKGAVQEEPGVRAPPREGSPPDKPALLRNDSSLRLELRDAVHSENKARAAEYRQQFEGYLSRYTEAALAAPSPLSLRMMGPPANEFVLLEPGLIGQDNQRFDSLGNGPTGRASAVRAVNDRISDFAGRTRAGSFSVTASAKLEGQGAGFGGQLEKSAKLTAEGKLSGSSKAEAKVQLNELLAVGVSADGKGFGELKLDGYKAKFEDGKLVEQEGKLGVLGLKLTEDKTTVSASLSPLVGGFATIDETHGSYGGGVKLGKKVELGELGELEFALKLGIEAQGVAPERLPDIASMKDDGIWGPMPELEGRVKWSAIAPERRARLSRDGWSIGNWPVR